MRVLLLLPLLCGLTSAAPAGRPLSDFNLTEAVVERYGFKDTPDGLRDTVRDAIFVGKDREKVLEEIKGWIEDEEQRRQAAEERRRQAEEEAKQAQPQGRPAPFGNELSKLANGSEEEDLFYDNQAGRNPGQGVVPAVPSGGDGGVRLEPSRTAPKQESRVPTPPLPAAPSSAVGVQARGSIDKLIALVLQNLPGESVADAARRLTEKATGAPSRVQTKEGLAAYCKAGSQSCLSALAAAYFAPKKAVVDEDASRLIGMWVRYGEGKKAPLVRLSPRARLADPEIQALIEKGFRSELVLGPDAFVRVVFSSDEHLLKNRGVWLANPVIREGDGSFTLVLNDKLISMLGSDPGWGGGADLTAALRATDAPERDHLLRDVLGGEDPEWMGSRLNYVLLGWMQADVLRRLGTAAAEGKAPEEARREAQNAVLRDPLESRLYTLANNSVTAWSDGVRGLEPKAARPSPLWDLVTSANAGDFGAVASLAQALERGRKRVDALNAELASLKDAHEKAREELKKLYDSSNADSAAVQAAEKKNLETLDRLDAVSDKAERAEKSWRKAMAYLGYLDLDRPEARSAFKAALPSLPAESRASAVTRLALGGAPEDIKTFAAAVVAKENEQGQAGYAQAAQAIEYRKGTPAPQPRTLGGADEAFLGALLQTLAARPALREDFKTFVVDLDKAGGQRTYEAVLARHSALWPKLRSQMTGDDFAALAAKAPAEVQATLRRALAVSGDLKARKAAAPADVEEEAVLERAARLNADFSTVEAAAQKVEARYNAYPMMIMDYLQEPAVIGPILDASRRTGMDPYLITAAAFQEGYIEFAKAIEKGEAARRTYYFHSMVGPMGLDSFPEYAERMKKRGWLRPDFNDYRVTLKPQGRGDYGDAEFTGPDPAEAALEALVGLLRLKRALFLGDAGSLGLRPSTFSRQELELWSYLYFNFTTPKEQLRKLGIGWVWKPCKTSDQVYNVKRVGATAQWLRELKFFDGFWPADKLGH